MKLCFVIGAMNYSGAEKVLSVVTEELKQMGHNIHIILLEKKNGEINIENGISLYGAKSVGKRFYRVINRWVIIRKLVNKIKPDVLISFGYVCNVNTLMAELGASIPLVVCERNDPFNDPRSVFQKLYRKILYRFASGYIFQTEKIKEYFSTGIQKKAAIIANPIVDSHIRWKQTKTEKKIVSVARLDDYQKDQIVMIRAFEKFSVRHPEYTLEIFGEGPDRTLLTELIKDLGMADKIRLLGKVNNPLERISKAEVFLLTSRFEGMPNALMEALSIGIPSISTDCGGGGAKALYQMCHGCLLVPTGDINSITEALDELVENENLQEELSVNGVRINDILNQKSIAKQWDEYLNRIIKK